MRNKSSRDSDSDLEFDITNKSRARSNKLNQNYSNSSDDASELDYSSGSDGEEGRKFRKYRNLNSDSSLKKKNLLKKRKIEAELNGEDEDCSSLNNHTSRASSSAKKYQNLPLSPEPSKSSSSRRMLQINEIEGQEDYQESETSENDLFAELKTDQLSDSESEASSEADIENDITHDELNPASKKKSLKKELKLEPFNVKNDYEEGKFDEEGNFVWNKKDKNDVYDVWMSDVHKKDIKNALKAQTAKQESLTNTFESLKKSSVALFDGLVPNSEVDLKSSLAFILDHNNNSLTTLSSLQKLKKDATKRSKKAKIKSLPDDKPQFDHIKTKILRITEICDKLIELGHINCYEWTRETLISKLGERLNHRFKFLSESPSSETSLNDSLEPSGLLDDLHSTFDNSNPADNSLSSTNANLNNSLLSTMWEYKWNCNPSAEIYGPFSSAEILAWKNANFFDSNSVFRKIGQLEFAPIDLVNFNT
ncbi:hypothetical protein BB561_003284 [Smittium simulii]|uniref:GYF domain-containing protein n=1 Tax=Smittium simulii TaxID=133385 RepID=A0A2T9YM58_9FUNG|nr:hypothetical protein BB561_003284 [Smittium simulii]